MQTSSRAPARARPVAQTVGYYLAFIALGLVSASLGPTLPGLAAQTQSALRDVSFLFSARAFGYLLGSFLSGRWYDRMAGHPLMAAMLLCMAALLFAVPLLSSLWILTLVLFVLGMAEGALDVGGNTLLVWAHRERVGPLMNGLHFFFGVGAFIAPLIIAQLVLASGGITWPYWALAILLLPAALWLLPLASPAARKAQAQTAGEVNHLLVLLVVAFFFLYAGAEVGFGGWIYTYAVALKLSTPTIAAYLTSTFWGALTVGRLLAIPIAARFAPRTILLVDLLGCMASGVVLLLGTQSLAATALGAFGMGLCMASIFPTTLVLAERRMTITGQVTAWFFVGSSLGAMFFPWLIGQLFEPVGPHSAMLVILSALLLDLIALWLLTFHANRSASRGVPLEDASPAGH